MSAAFTLGVRTLFQQTAGGSNLFMFYGPFSVTSLWEKAELYVDSWGAGSGKKVYSTDLADTALCMMDEIIPELMAGAKPNKWSELHSFGGIAGIRAWCLRNAFRPSAAWRALSSYIDPGFGADFSSYDLEFIPFWLNTFVSCDPAVARTGHVVVDSMHVERLLLMADLQALNGERFLKLNNS